MAEPIVVDEPDDHAGMTVAEMNVELARLIMSRHAGDRIRRIERVEVDPTDANAFYGWRFYVE